MSYRPSPPSLQLALQLLEHSSDGLVAFDREYRYLYWSGAMEEMTGLSAEDVLGQRALQLFPFLSAIGESALFEQALGGEVVTSRRRPFQIVATGRSGFFDGRYAPLVDGGGQVIGAVGVIRNITEQHLAAQRLGETEARFKAMADVSPVLLWMSGTDGFCTFSNQTWLDFTGRTLDDEWGVGWTEGVHPEDFAACMDTYNEAFNLRHVFETEYRLKRRDGEYRWILDRGTPRYQPDGTFAGFIGSCIDISDRKQLEVELRQAVRARDDFLSVASHELRTPVATLQLQLESLNRVTRGDGAVSQERLAQALAVARRQSQRLTELMDLLLDVSNLAHGPLPLNATELDLGELAGEIVDRLSPAAGSNGTTLHLERRDGVGGLAGTWDQLRLEQVLVNLLSNAIKYGAGKPVQVLLEGREDEVTVSVADEGIGISREDAARIFERFERAVSSRNYGGFGLGLWITQEIVSALGGHIEVDSELGRGARFQVTLPRRPPVGSVVGR